ncbi:unnamed protein product, partial [Scytosiphon promiscuus]
CREAHNTNDVDLPRISADPTHGRGHDRTEKGDAAAATATAAPAVPQCVRRSDAGTRG